MKIPLYPLKTPHYGLMLHAGISVLFLLNFSFSPETKLALGLGKPPELGFPQRTQTEKVLSSSSEVQRMPPTSKIDSKTGWLI